MEKIDILKLVEITSKILFENKISDLSSVEFGCEPENIWSKIASEYFAKSFEKKKCAYILSWWDCDLQNYSTLVKEKLNQKETVDGASTMLVFSQNEWENATKCITGESRKKFKIEFDAILSSKLQEKGFSCWLKCYFNWFKKNNSKKRICNFWNGSFYCLENRCGEFDAFIKEEPKPFGEVIVYLKIKPDSKIINHEKIEKNVQLRGHRKQRLLSQIMLYGTDQARSKVIIENNEKSQPINLPVKRSIYNDIKYRHIHRERISTDIFSDALATKTNYETLVPCLIPNSSCKGLIQEISMVPFGILFLSDIQMKIWGKIRKNRPIWYFDATGSVLVDIQNQKKPFLYSFVAQDPKNKTIVPVAEFITTSHVSSNLSKFIISIRNMISKNHDSLPSIIVTDFSYALINSVMNSYNQCSLNIYFLWSFDFVVRKKGREDFFHKAKVVMYLCSTHFLKLIINKTKTIKCSKKSKKFLHFCFSLLQNCKSIEQFENYLINIFNIFNQKFKYNTVEFSIKFIRSSLIRTNLNSENMEEFKSSDQVERDKEFEYIVNDINDSNANDFEKNIVETSPFKIFFKTMIDEFKSLLITEENNFESEHNEYYCPDLFNVISNYLYLVPLWSGLIIGQVTFEEKFYFNRLSNNPVENWFGCLKNKLLQKRKVRTSEYSNVIYTKLLSLYYEYYSNENGKSNVTERLNEITESMTKNTNLNIEEVWKDKNAKIKRVKSYHYKNVPYFLQEDENVFTETEAFGNSSDFIELFGESLTQDNDCLQTLYSYLSKVGVSYIQIKNLLKINKQLILDINDELVKIQNYTSYTDQKLNQNFLGLIKENNIIDYHPAIVELNGNCIYESLSLLYFNKTENFYIFKLGSIFSLLENEVFFSSLMKNLKYEITFEELIITTNHENASANELNILSLSLFLKKVILVYNYDPHDVFKFNIKYDLSGNKENPLPIGQILNHYIPLLKKSENAFLPDIENDLYQTFREKLVNFTEKE